ncbi:MAG: hypothetical protein ACLFPF_09930, partial [Halanaerobiales bacterium]
LITDLKLSLGNGISPREIIILFYIQKQFGKHSKKREVVWMRKTIIFLLLLSIPVLVLSACSNPEGGLGPSWDVALKVPLVKGSEDNVITVQDIIGDDTNIEDGFNKNLLDGDNTYDLGTELTDYTFPDVEEGASITLPTIEVAGIIGTLDQSVPLAAPTTLDDLDTLTFSLPPTFNMLTFASLDKEGNAQQAVVEVSNNSQNVTIESLSIDLTYNDGNSLQSKSMSFDDIGPGETSSPAAFMSGVVNSIQKSANLSILNDDINITGSITTAGSSEIGDNMTISITFPDVIKSVEGIDTSMLTIDELISGDIQLDNLNLEEGIRSITFGSGNLGIALPQISGLSFNWDNLSIAGLTDSDNDGIIPLSGKTIDVSSSSLTEVGYQLQITDTGEIFDYSAGNTIGISGGFNNTSLSSVTVDVSQLNLTDFNKEVNMDDIVIDIDRELREELSKIDISPEIIAHIAGLEGMTMDFSGVEFTALDSNDNIVKKDDLDYQFNLGSGHTGLDFDIDLMEKEPNLLDFIKNPDTTTIRIDGSYDISGQNVIVNADSVVGIESIDVHIPYQFEIAEEISVKGDPEAVQAIEKDSYDDIKDRLKGILVIEDLNNNFPLVVELRIYAADIDNMSTANPGIDEIKDYLYSEGNLDEHLIKTVSIDQRTDYPEFLAELNMDDFSLFTQDNVYAGMELILPEGEYGLSDGDEFSFSHIYMKLTGTVND